MKIESGHHIWKSWIKVTDQQSDNIPLRCLRLPLQAKGFLHMLELFCRKPDAITIHEEFHLTDISTGEEASSLSAILLDDAYYNFALANTTVSEGLHHANDVALKQKLSSIEFTKDFLGKRKLPFLYHKNSIMDIKDYKAGTFTNHLHVE